MPHVAIKYNQFQTGGIDAIKVQKAVDAFKQQVLSVRNKIRVADVGPSTYAGKRKVRSYKNIPSYRPICLLNAMGGSLILLYWCRRKTETARLFGERFPEIGELEESDWEDNRVPHIVLSTALPKRTGGNIVNERHIFCHFLNIKEGEHPLKTAYGHLWALV
jgi:hypothetical protein